MSHPEHLPEQNGEVPSHLKGSPLIICIKVDEFILKNAQFRTSQIQLTPASNLPDFTFPIFVLVIEISHGSLIVGLSRQDSLQNAMDKDDFFNNSVSCSVYMFICLSLYVVELTNISHCLLIVRCQRWLELDEPNWEATWAGAGWRTSDELEFFSESAKDCSLFVIFYLLSTDELAYLRQSTVEHFVTYET